MKLICIKNQIMRVSPNDMVKQCGYVDVLYVQQMKKIRINKNDNYLHTKLRNTRK